MCPWVLLRSKQIASCYLSPPLSVLETIVSNANFFENVYASSYFLKMFILFINFYFENILRTFWG